MIDMQVGCGNVYGTWAGPRPLHAHAAGDRNRDAVLLCTYGVHCVAAAKPKPSPSQPQRAGSLRASPLARFCAGAAAATRQRVAGTTEGRPSPPSGQGLRPSLSPPRSKNNQEPQVPSYPKL